MRLIALLFLLARLISTQKNNVCKTVRDYYTIETNENCWYDYLTNATGPEILMKSGRPFETHKVTTPDGHILTVFRISNENSLNKQRNPVLLQHGFISSSDNWIALGNDSLAFQLNDKGYDVWLGNYRGNRYSDEHVKYSAHDVRYWDHTIDDLALQDLPYMLQTISNATGGQSKVILIGHSMGCTLGLMYSSELPEEAQKMIKFMVLTAPAYYLTHMVTPYKIIIPFGDLILDFVYKHGLVNVVSNEKITQRIFRLICLDSPKLMNDCVSALNLFFGLRNGIKPENYPKLLMQQPSGTSIKVARHIVDFAKNTFRKYDYGINNYNVYGSYEPPSYNVTKITVPTVVIYAKNDWLTAKPDVLMLYKHLAEEARYGLYEVEDDNFNHMDFVFGSNSRKVYVDWVLRMFDKLQDL